LQLNIVFDKIIVELRNYLQLVIDIILAIFFARKYTIVAIY